MSDSLPTPASPDILPDLVAAALKAGADAAEAVSAERAALSVGVRNGALEDVEREESRDLGLRVFIGRRQATVSASDLSDATRARLVERAVAMARLAPEDPYAGLAPKDRLAQGPFADLDLFDPSERSAAELEAVAAEAEAAALAVPGVARSEGGHASASSSRWRLVTSHGFDGAYHGSAFSLGVGVIAEKDGAMERGGEHRATRHLSDLPAADRIGVEAGRRAVARTGPRKIASTGHASRGLAGPPGVSTHSLTLEPGERDLDGLMADAGAGLLVTSMFGPSLNANTGDWSAGVSGFWFQNGELAWPVSEVTVAGKLTDLYARMQRGSDLEFRGANNSPSLMFDAVAIAGK
jgi:predicted Zn-dependent protease